jgi:hypothetical protein
MEKTFETEITINGKRYDCVVTVEKGEKAPREYGRPLWPDSPDFICDLQAIAYTPKGTERVTSERIINQLVDRAEQLI